MDDALLAERVLLTLLAAGMIPGELVHADDFSVDIHKNAAEWLLAGRNAASFVEAIEGEDARAQAMQALNYSPLPEDHDNIMRLAESSLTTIRRHRARGRMAEIEEEIKTADPQRKKELYKQMQTIMQAIED